MAVCRARFGTALHCCRLPVAAFRARRCGGTLRILGDALYKTQKGRHEINNGSRRAPRATFASL